MGLFDQYTKSEKEIPERFSLPSEDPETEEEFQTLQDEELKEKIRKLKIGNEKELNTLVSKDLVKAILSEVGHSIQTSFIDLPRRESPNLAASLGIPNLERDLEKKWSDLNKKAIESVLNNIGKLSADGVFE